VGLHRLFFVTHPPCALRLPAVLLVTIRSILLGSSRQKSSIGPDACLSFVMPNTRRARRNFHLDAKVVRRSLQERPRAHAVALIPRQLWKCATVSISRPARTNDIPARVLRMSRRGGGIGLPPVAARRELHEANGKREFEADRSENAEHRLGAFFRSACPRSSRASGCRSLGSIASSRGLTVDAQLRAPFSGFT